MNIFYLDHNQKKAVSLMTNSHVVKMTLETAQLLSTAHRVLDGREAIFLSSKSKRKIWIHPDPYKEKTLYKATHMNHPCAIWVRASLENYQWLYRLFCELTSEYTLRYGKVHRCETLLKEVLKNPPKNIPGGNFFEPPLAMPDDYRKIGDSKSSYIQYYISEKLKKENDIERFYSRI